MLRNNQLNAYFNRIGLKDKTVEEVRPTLELLTQLHELHAFSIPFENLSIHLNQAINIDIESIYKKLVENQRGGYCYEMNGLFYAVLKTLGFNVQLHLAEISESDSELRSNKETHLMLIIHLDDKKYLADVGFGRNGLIHPLLLETENFKQNQIYSTLFEVKYDVKNGFVYGVYIDGKFKVEYRFDFPVKQNLILTDLQSYSDDISKRSHFTKMILVSMPTKDGRKMLHNDMLKHFDSHSKKVTIHTYDTYLSILKSEFGITFDETLNFSNIPTLASKMITDKEAITNDISLRSTAMLDKGNKNASGKPTMWTLGLAQKNEPESTALIRQNCVFYR